MMPVLAGERRGAAIEGFDTGNSPVEISKFMGRRSSDNH